MNDIYDIQQALQNINQSTMNYKDKLIEIDDTRIKFKNNIFVFFMITFIPLFIFSVTSSKGDISSVASSLLGLLTVFMIIRLYLGIYLKNQINLSDIDYINVQTWDKSIDENRNFWGTGKFKYHFPTGLNKKTNPNVIFVHIKGRKAAVGFVPENMDNLLSVLKERGIKVTGEIY